MNTMQEETNDKVLPYYCQGNFMETQLKEEFNYMIVSILSPSFELNAFLESWKPPCSRTAKTLPHVAAIKMGS